MNKHLNVFTSYSSEDRDTQLENDLTRALAICFQEDNLFLFSVIRKLLKNDDKLFDNIFADFSDSKKLSIEIQQNVSNVSGFETIYAVSISESELNIPEFFNQKNDRSYLPIPDITIKIDDVVFIFEIKRNAEDTTSQLYNQALNLLRQKTENKESLKANDSVTPIDFNWFEVMILASKVLNFEKASLNQNRFLADFIELVKRHNHNWLPEIPLANLNSDNTEQIYRRIETIISSNESDLEPLENRLGFAFDQAWADEVLISLTNEEEILIRIYPGNTKGQGLHIFTGVGEPKFKSEIDVANSEYHIEKAYHIKFTSFQRYFTGLWFQDKDLKKELYTKENFREYTGRKKRASGSWEEIEALFDISFKEDYQWKKECDWDKKVIGSGKSQFDISFGYELSFKIPFKIFKNFDKDKKDIQTVVSVFQQINNQLKDMV